MKVLVTGATGQVGSALRPRLAGHDVLAATRAELDLANPDSIIRAVRAARPEVIVNCAAYTAVDRAETERLAAHAVNAEAPRILASEAKRLGALLVHYSTDYVFDGEKAAPYVEDDATNPLGIYGATKLAGEQAIENAGCRYLVLRTSWVYAPRGSNFLLTMLRLAKERPELRVVNDQFGAPTSADAIAEGTLRLLARGAEGMFHMTCAGRTTWHEFAVEIVRCTGLATPVLPINSSEYPTAARRPRNSVLSCERLLRAHGVALPSWQEAFARTMAQLGSRGE